MLAHTAAGFLIDVGKVGWEKTQTVCLQCSRCEAKSLTPTPLSMPKGVTANHTSAASFRRFPISVPAACAVRATDRHHRGRLLLVTSLGEAREVTRLPGRIPAWSSGRTGCVASPACSTQPRSRSGSGSSNSCTAPKQGDVATPAWRMKRRSAHCRGE